jgi:hypothetical protein
MASPLSYPQRSRRESAREKLLKRIILGELVVYFILRHGPHKKREQFLGTHRQQGAFISLLFLFKNKESRLKMCLHVSYPFLLIRP